MPEKALPYFTANLEIKIANGINRKQLFSDYANIASAYIRLKNYRMFKAYIDTATQINQAFPTSRNLLALKIFGLVITKNWKIINMPLYTCASKIYFKIP